MHHSSRLWLLAAALLLALPTAGGTTDRATPPEDDPGLTERILAEEQHLEVRVVGLSRVRASFPQRVSGSLGAMIVRQPSSYDCRTVCQFKGPIFQAEPGYSGGRLSAGYAVVTGEKGDNEHFLSKVFLGYGVKGALLRTWNDADLTPSDQTLLGIEGDFTVIRVNFSLGVFKEVGSAHPDDPWVVTGGVGWGF